MESRKILRRETPHLHYDGSQRIAECKHARSGDGRRKPERAGFADFSVADGNVRMNAQRRIAVAGDSDQHGIASFYVVQQANQFVGRSAVGKGYHDVA